MFDAILLGVYVGVCVGAAAAGVISNTRAKEEEKTVYTFGDPAAIVETAETPEIVVTDGE